MTGGGIVLLVLLVLLLVLVLLMRFPQLGWLWSAVAPGLIDCEGAAVCGPSAHGPSAHEARKAAAAARRELRQWLPAAYLRSCTPNTGSTWIHRCTTRTSPCQGRLWDRTSGELRKKLENATRCNRVVYMNATREVEKIWLRLIQ